MGTSASSSGPGSGVVLIPPWVEDPEFTPATAPEDAPKPDGEQSENCQDVLPQLAPPRRFQEARTSLGRFAESGSASSLSRGIRRYVRTGLGGSQVASRRMARTAAKAGALYGVLHSLSSGTTPAVDLGLDAARMTGLPARAVVDRIATALSPSDGTQDSEASRHSISQALCELLKREPTADLLALTQEQIDLVIEVFIGEDICRRIELDVGKTVFDRAPNPATAIRRLEEIYRYVRQVVAASFRRQIANSEPLTHRSATSLASRVMGYTFEVFESYLS